RPPPSPPPPFPPATPPGGCPATPSRSEPRPIGWVQPTDLLKSHELGGFHPAYEVPDRDRLLRARPGSRDQSTPTCHCRFRLGVALGLLVELLFAIRGAEVVGLAAVFTLAGCLLGLNVRPANRILSHGALSLPQTEIRRRYRPGRDQVDRTGCGELAPTQASSATGKITSRRHAAGVRWWELVGG